MTRPPYVHMRVRSWPHRYMCVGLPLFLCMYIGSRHPWCPRRRRSYLRASPHGPYANKRCLQMVYNQLCICVAVCGPMSTCMVVNLYYCVCIYEAATRGAPTAAEATCEGHPMGRTPIYIFVFIYVYIQLCTCVAVCGAMGVCMLANLYYYVCIYGAATRGARSAAEATCEGHPMGRAPMYISIFI